MMKYHNHPWHKSKYEYLGTLLLTWINFDPKLQINHPLPNFNGCTVEVSEWIRYIIPSRARRGPADVLVFWPGTSNGITDAYLPSYPGYFRGPHWFSMGLPEISRVTWQVCIWWSAFLKSFACYTLSFKRNDGRLAGDGIKIILGIRANVNIYRGPFTEMD